MINAILSIELPWKKVNLSLSQNLNKKFKIILNRLRRKKWIRSKKNRNKNWNNYIKNKRNKNKNKKKKIVVKNEFIVIVYIIIY